MIDFLRGRVAFIEQDYLVIDVQGVGYQVFTGNPFIFSVKEEVMVYTHYHVREDAIQLFGFATKDEQVLFRKLIDVSGIGPRVGLGILRGAQPQQIIAMIQQENVQWLTKLPGIGKKTAQRIVLDLKDKLDGLSSAVPEMGAHEPVQSDTIADGNVSIWSEAKQALDALGYQDHEAEKALQQIRNKVSDQDGVDQIIKQALQALYKGGA